MIFWIFHKKLTSSDWKNATEGCPKFFYESLENLIFMDISEFSFFGKIENLLLPKPENLFDTSLLKDKFKIIKNKKNLKVLLNSKSDDLFVFQSLNNPRTKKLLAILNKLNKKSLLLNHWTLPPEMERRPEKKTLRFFAKKIKTINFKVLLLRFFYKINKRIEKKNLYCDFAFACGEKQLSVLKKRILIKTVLPCHSLSYDEFLSLSNEKILNEPYFVFVDQAMTIHPDNKGFSQNATKFYHSEIISVLNKISTENNNIKIVIAQHPRIQYENGFWENFECLDGKTAQLIKHADGIIGHFSTSLILAHICAKPIYFLTTTSSYFPFADIIKRTAKFLGGKLIDMKEYKILEDYDYNGTNLKDSFSLRPDDKRGNLEIFLEFIKNYNKSK